MHIAEGDYQAGKKQYRPEALNSTMNSLQESGWTSTGAKVNIALSLENALSASEDQLNNILREVSLESVEAILL